MPVKFTKGCSCKVYKYTELYTQLKELKAKVDILMQLPHIVLMEQNNPPATDQHMFFNTASDVFKHCHGMGEYTKEVFRVLLLNSKNLLLADQIINIGDIRSCPVEINEICRLSIKYGAQKIITVHNHPSGDTQPSAEDLRLVKKIGEAASKFHIILADNLIIGKDRFSTIPVK